MLKIILGLSWWFAQGSTPLAGEVLDLRGTTIKPITFIAGELPELKSDKALVASIDGRTVFYQSQATSPQAIASLSKLMTALVFLDHNPGWETSYVMRAEDNVAGGKLNLFLGEEVLIKDLLATSLIASDNGATMALVQASGLTVEEFVAAMNQRAQELGLVHTNFADPTGLSPENVSTATELLKLAKELFVKEEVARLLNQPEYQFTTLNGRAKSISSTNHLLFDSEELSFAQLGAKTGYIDEAGYCFLGWFTNEAGQQLAVVILNSEGANQRFQEAKRLATWVYQGLK
ncbi:MAG: D-alanyl-D-alanine carboxypeptidase family protein [Patescibacteria group bacterium]